MSRTRNRPAIKRIKQTLAAAVCALAIGSMMATPSLAAPGGVYWSGDFLPGVFSKWDHVHDGSENAVNGNTAAQIVDAPGRPDGFAVSLSDNGMSSGGAARAEVGNNPTTNRGNEGEESYYRFSVYFPSSNRANWAPNVWDHNNFFQFIGTDWVKPAINLGLDTGDFGINNPHIFFNFNVAANGTIDDRRGGRWDLGAVRYDTWTDFIIHVRWSSTSSGLLQAWMNGNEVVPFRNARTLGNAPVIMEIQNYRPASPNTTVHIFDQVRIGESYDAVQ